MVTPGSPPDPPPPGPRPAVRVLWLIKGLGPGGAEHLLALFARQRDRDALSIRAAYLLGHKSALVPALETEGVATTLLGDGRASSGRWLPALRRALDDHPVDVVHAHSPLAAVGARLVLRSMPAASRPRLVTTDHSTWSGHGRLTRWADRATYRLDDAHTVVSNAVLASLPTDLQQTAEVVVPGIDVASVRRARSERDAVRRELRIANDALVVGTVANLRPVKAYPVLLAAARTVTDCEPGVRFVAVGQGPQAGEIRSLQQDLGLTDAFQLLGYRSDAVRVMAACDLFCLPSLHEGLPVALMEALALGLPVVASDVGGIRELVDNGREGILVPPGDAVALGEALLSVLRDARLRADLGAAAAVKGASLNVAASVARMEVLYAELAAI